MFEIKLIFYGVSRMLQFSQFVWTLSYLVWDVFNNFLLIDATDRSKIRSDQKRFFIALSLYPLSFFANTPFNYEDICIFLADYWNLENSNDSVNNMTWFLQFSAPWSMIWHSNIYYLSKIFLHKFFISYSLEFRGAWICCIWLVKNALFLPQKPIIWAKHITIKTWMCEVHVKT